MRRIFQHLIRVTRGFAYIFAPYRGSLPFFGSAEAHIDA